jgi:uncharacterized protein YqeY
LAQIAVIESFTCPIKREAEVSVIAKLLLRCIRVASMGKVMGLASAQLGGTAEGKVISTVTKETF